MRRWMVDLALWQLAFAFDRDSLESAVTSRVGQNVLTCPTTACYWLAG